MNVQFFDLKRQYHQDAAALKKTAAAILDSGHFILGPNVHSFEKKTALYHGVTHALGLASGSDALWLGLLALGIKPDDEVITTPYTFVATATAISKIGAIPVFVDIEPDTFHIDPKRIEKVISRKTKAIIPVHLFGQSADMTSIMKIAKKHRLLVLEDAAQSFGALCGAHLTGAIGDLGALSYYPTKNLGAAGDGGMILTRQARLAERILELRQHGSKKRYFHDGFGWNSRLDEIQAGILLFKLDRLERNLAARKRNAKMYLEGLSDCPLVLPAVRPLRPHTFNQFVIRTDCRDELRDFLSQKGIGTEIYYPLPLHLQKVFASLAYQPGDFPESEAAAQESMALPIYPELEMREVLIVIKVIRSFFGLR